MVKGQMADNIHLSENCRIFIDTTEVHGVQSTSFGFSQPHINKQIIGGQNFEIWPNGPQSANLSIESFLISKDLFYRYVYDLPYLNNFYAIFNRDNSVSNINLSTGYLNSYNVSCSVGEIPSTNVSFEFLGDFAKNVVNSDTNLINSNTVFDSGIYQSAAASIEININNQKLQAISFNADLRANRQNVYQLGSRDASSNIIWPIDVTCQFSIPSNIYTTYGLKGFPQKIDKQNIDIYIKSLKDNQTISAYNFEDMVCVEENLNTSLSNNPTINLTYKGVIKEKPELPAGIFFYSDASHSQSFDSTNSKILNLDLSNRNFDFSSVSKVGSSFNFSNDGYAVYPISDYTIGNSMTFAIMVQSTDFNKYETDSLGTCILSLFSSIYGALGPRLYIYAEEIFFRTVFGTAYSTGGLGIVSLDSNEAKFICCVVDANANNSRIYANDMTPFITSYFYPNINEGYIYIGKNPLNQQYLNGSVSKFAIYNRALSQQEVEKVYRNFTS